MDLADALRQAGCSEVLKLQYLSIFEDYDKELEINLEQKSTVEFDEEGPKRQVSPPLQQPHLPARHLAKRSLLCSIVLSPSSFARTLPTSSSLPVKS